MKKYISIVIGLTLCLLLMACGNTNENGNGNMESDQNITSEGSNDNHENSTWCIDISISDDGRTDMQLYLDESQNINEIYCRITETEQIASKANVVGMQVKDGIYAILDAGYTLGYFTDNRTVNVNVSKEPNSLSLYTMLCECGADYIFSNKHYFTYGVGLNESEAANLSGTYARASKDEEGRIWKWHDTYQNGTCKSQVGEAVDGSTDEIHFNTSTGNTEHTKKTLSNGYILEQKYEADGSLAYYYEKQADGTYIEQEYVKGMLVKEAKKDSVVEQIITYENGTVKKQWTKSSSEISELIYDVNGKIIEQSQILPNGKKTTIYFNAKGNPEKERVEYPDGSGVITYYDEYGYVIKEERF